MAGAGVAEVGTLPSVNFIDTFFTRFATDERYAKVEYVQFNSCVSLETTGTQLVFVLNAQEPPYCYDIKDILLKVNIRILKENGDLPSKEDIIFPVNNCALSAFEKLQFKINDVPVSKNEEFYGYKSYLQYLISFSEQAKSSNLMLSGWCTDSYTILDGVGSLEPSSENEGMLARNAWFREQLRSGTDQPYSKEGKDKHWHIFSNLLYSLGRKCTQQSMSVLTGESRYTDINMYFYYEV